VPGLLSWSINTEPFLARIKLLHREANKTAFPLAVYRTAQHAIRGFIAKTPQPPTPPGQKYQRTGRLVSGWGPAAKQLGAGAPGPATGEGRFVSTNTNDVISILMANDVPYAGFVEILGPAARFGPGIKPIFKGGVRMVGRTFDEMRASRVFEGFLAQQWAFLL